MMESSFLPSILGQGRVVAIAAILAVGGSLGGYAIHEHNVAKNLAAQNVQTVSALNATEHEVSELTAKVNTLAARAEEQPTPPVPSAQIATAQKPAAAHRLREDSRFKKLQTQIDAQGKEIEQTRTDLTSTQGDLVNTRTELTGSIAHTHDELVLLEKKGERDYTEFDIFQAKGFFFKSNDFRRAGPFEIRLRKADSKHQYADLDLLVDDRNLSQKHVNLYQPVMFSTPDSPQPVEVVINSISKDHIHGYVSAPKYRQSELASMSDAQENTAPSQAADGTDAGVAQPARQQLPKPQP